MGRHIKTQKEVMETITPRIKSRKKDQPAFIKLLQTLIRKTESEKRIAVYGRDPLREK
jgi:hypothetical protein